MATSMDSPCPVSSRPIRLPGDSPGGACYRFISGGPEPGISALALLGGLFVFWQARKTNRFFFFNAPATAEIYSLSLHDALPISHEQVLISTCIPRQARRA